MKKIILTLSLTGLITIAFAQQNPTAVKYAEIVNAKLAKKHLSIIASDAYEGRETGKPGAEKAANYIANEFESLGLQPIVNGSYFLKVPIVTHVLKTSFSVNNQVFLHRQDFYAGRADYDKSVNTSDILFVGYGTEEEIGNTDLTGKILLWINEDKPVAGKTTDTTLGGNPARGAVSKNLRSKNPAVILAVSGAADALLKRIKGRTPSIGMAIKKDNSTPVGQTDGFFWVTTQLADQLLKSSGKTYRELKSACANGVISAQTVKADVKLSYYTEYNDVKAVDVLGYLPGSDPKLKDETLVISAHYDHIGLEPEDTKGDRINNGADDDGSGTTAIMSIARAFSRAKKDGHGPRRSILFLGNVGEEKGLLGSEYYTDHPVIPLASTIADINIDMIGRIGDEYKGKADSANYVYVVGSGMLSTDLHNAGENANKTYTNLVLDYKYDDPKDPNDVYHRSDHYNFAKHGVPIIFYYNGEHPDYHGVGDEVSKINFPLLAKRARLAFYTAWDLVNADKRPVVVGKK